MLSNLILRFLYRSFHPCVVAGFIMGLTLATSLRGADLIYDNTLKSQNEIFGSPLEFGDEIILGGVSRFVSGFALEYHGKFTPQGDETMTIRFYENNGTIYSPGFVTPGATNFWASEPLILTNGYATIIFDDLRVKVPNTFTWTVEIKGVNFAAGEYVGLPLYSPPTIGNNYSDYWQRNIFGLWLPHDLNNSLTNLDASFAFRLLATSGNFRPSLEPVTNRIVIAGKAVELLAMGSDTNVPVETLRYSLAGIVPPNASIDPVTGRFSWIPPVTTNGISKNFSIVVTDNGGPPALSATQTFNITALPLPKIASFTTAGSQLSVSLQTVPGVDYVLEYTSDFVTWVRSSAPVRATGSTLALLDANTGGTTRFYRGAIAQLAVDQVNLPPVFDPMVNPLFPASRPIYARFNATDPNIPTQSIRYSLDGPHPGGVSVDPVTGFLSWFPNPTKTGFSQRLAVRATDNGVPALSTVKEVLLTVLPLPVISSAFYQNGDMKFQVATIPGVSYSLQYVTNLNAQNWTTIGPSVLSTGGSVTLVDQAPVGPIRFYRAILSTLAIHQVNFVPTLASLPNRIIAGGQTVSVQASATDTNLPAQKLQFSLVGPVVPGASITPAGLFTWPTPIVTNTLTQLLMVRVSDSGSPSLSATQTFSVRVLPHPSAKTIVNSGNQVEIVVAAAEGGSYAIEFKDDFSQPNWTRLGQAVTATGGTWTFIDSAPTSATRFYRILLLD